LGGSPTSVVAALLDRTDPLENLALEENDGEYAGRFEQVTAMWPLMLPHHPDLLAAHSHARLNRGLTRNRSATEPLVAAIGASNQPVGAPSASAVLLALAAKNGVERTRGVDALVDLSSRAFLDGALLGAQLSELLGADIVVGSRIVPGLAESARADPRSARMVLDCLTTALPVLPGRRDAHQYVDLLAQLAVEQGRSVQLPPPFIQAATAKGTSMLAKACRRVPQR
jgi:hypothetical protein